MLATILKSAKAIQTTIAIIDTFSEFLDNELITSPKEMEVKIKLPFLEFKRKIIKVKK